MPCSFEFSPPRRILLCRITGELDDPRVHAYYAAMTRCSRAHDPQIGITWLDVTPMRVTPQAVQELAWLPPAMPDPTRPRFVVAPADDAYGLVRLFQLHGEATRPRLTVVRAMDEVFRHLYLHEPPAFSPLAGFDCD